MFERLQKSNVLSRPSARFARYFCGCGFLASRMRQPGNAVPVQMAEVAGRWARERMDLCSNSPPA